MDEPSGRPLSCEEKEKLKEKLAFLKREYTKTLARLQRAQRADKAKNAIKKLQGRDASLQQGISPQLNGSEPKNKAASPRDTFQSNTHLDEHTGGKTPATLVLEPESLNHRDGPAERSHVQRTDATQEQFPCAINCVDGEKRQNVLPWKGRKQQRGTLTSQERESLCGADSLLLSGKRFTEQEGVKRENPKTAATETRTCLSSSPVSDIPDSPVGLPEAHGESRLIPPTARLQSTAEEFSGGRDLPRVSTLLSPSPADSRTRCQQLKHESLEGNSELAAPAFKNVSPVSPANFEAQHKTTTVFSDVPALNAIIGPDSQPPRSPDSEADNKLTSKSQLVCDNLMTHENRNFKDKICTENFLNSFKGSDESLLENEAVSQDKRTSPEVVSLVSADNQTHSCTVLEGLLFPAEYYVRTTRSMSNCQRKVALEACIQSHLGVRKKRSKSQKNETAKKSRLSNEDTDQRGMSDTSEGRASSRSPSQEVLSLTEVKPAEPSEADVSRKVVTQPLSGRHGRKGKAVGSPRSDHHEPCLPASGSLGVNNAKDQVPLCRAQAQKAVCHGKEVHGPKHPSRPSKNAGLTSDHHASPKDTTLALQQLQSVLRLADFELPDEDFGLLKSEKLKSCSETSAGPLEAKTQRGGSLRQAKHVVSKALGSEQVDTDKEDLVCPARKTYRQVSRRQSQRQKGLSSSMLLFTLTDTVAGDDTDGPMAATGTPTFPILGATPALNSQPLCEQESVEAVGQVCAASQLSHSKTTASLCDGRERDRWLSQANLDGSPPTSGSRTRPSCGPGPLAAPLPGGTVASKENQEHQLRGNTCREFQARSVEQAEVAALPACDSLSPGSLQLVSKLKNPSGSCPVDVCAVWWEIANQRIPCIVTACEYVVSLWKPLDTWQWEKVSSWHFTEVPVLQIVPLPDVSSLVCVALGNLEIREIRALLCSDGEREKQVLLGSGNIKAVLGLTNRRLVSSSGALCGQQVEVLTFAEDGGRSRDKQLLMPPEETILTFAEVQGMQEALLGTTIMNNIVIWNLNTGQLLKKMHIGDSYQTSVCHKAYSDMGLLFAILNHPCAKESEPLGSPVFQLIAINPMTTLSASVMLYCLPRGQAGRFLEGDVKENLAAAVLTSGTIAVWDLLLGHCTALLPPVSDQSWSFVKWSGTDSHLLAGQKDGNIFVYRH